MAVPHPIPYQGSKRGLADKILRYFPAAFERLIEPFAGSAAMSLATAYSARATDFVLGDANEPLIDLWSMILHQPQQLTEAYRLRWNEQKNQEKTYYNHIRDRFNKSKCPEDFLYLLARCVKASIRYNAQGEFNQGPDNRRSGAAPDTMGYHISRASQLLTGKTSLIRGDYRLTLAQARPNDIVYMDPPYQGVCGRRNPRYSNQLDLDDFVDALRSLNRRGIAFLVSYDGRTQDYSYGEILPPFLHLTRIEVKAGRSTQATLLGRRAETFESLYLSPALCTRLPGLDIMMANAPVQMTLLLEKCPKAVIDHILEHGFVTTEELTSIYGYEHAPRAARDVREEGVPLEMFRVKSSSGRSIGAYRFGDLATIRQDRIGGRAAFSKQFKRHLIQSEDSRCAVCGTVYDPRYLQVDHRVPYEVAGDISVTDRKTQDYMLLCASCNRAKSWSCTSSKTSCGIISRNEASM